MAILIVGYTMVVVHSNLDLIGDAQKISGAKDILLLLLGLAGVVMGYYFGRVPADAQATQAQKQATAATARTEQVDAQAQQVVMQAGQLASRIVAAYPAKRTPGEAPDPALMSELQQLQTGLQQLSRLAQTRIN